ncbi:hypothetical protein D9M69_679820 [compost metagenome]
MFISMTDMQLLTRLRREQGIFADDWAQLMELADLSVHGALMHARHRGFEVPEVGYGLMNQNRVIIFEAEVAWEYKRVAISITDAPEIAGWTIVSPANFIGKYP